MLTKRNPGSLAVRRVSYCFSVRMKLVVVPPPRPSTLICRVIFLRRDAVAEKPDDQSDGHPMPVTEGALDVRDGDLNRIARGLFAVLLRQFLRDLLRGATLLGPFSNPIGWAGVGVLGIHVWDFPDFRSV